MYAFPILPRYAEDTVSALLAETDSEYWFSVSEFSHQYALLSGMSYRQQLEAVEAASPRLYALIDQHYRRIPRLITLNVLKLASAIARDSESDFSRLFELSGFDGRRTLETIMRWRVRLSIKAFWVAREMRMRGVWTDRSGEPIAGEYCCVVDIQVERALECLGVDTEGLDLFAKSKLVWDAFGDSYDLPLLWLGRNYCSSRSGRECPMAAQGLCSKRSTQKSLFEETP